MRHFIMLMVVLAAAAQIALAFHVPSYRQRRAALHVMSSRVEEPGKLLYDAAYVGDVEAMKLVLKDCKGKPDQINWSSPQRYGRTPLVIACYYNQVEAVKLLLKTPGIDVNKGIDFGTTALMYAAHRGHVETTKVLLADRRTNVNIRATGGRWAGKTALKLVTELRGYVTENSKVSDLLRARGGVV